jgi:hypothetical protein
MESVEDPHFPVLTRGERPILFLKWSEAEGAYTFATGTPDSVFLLEGEFVTSHGRSRVARELAGLTGNGLVPDTTADPGRCQMTRHITFALCASLSAIAFLPGASFALCHCGLVYEA